MHTIERSIIFVIFCGLFNCIDARTIGSNNIVARQQAAYFKANETNHLLGFSVFESGIVLQNKNTHGYVDLFFPISGSLVLNGGTLVLQKDTTFKTPFSLSSGTINGNGYAIEFPRNISSLELPAVILNTPIDLVTQSNVMTNANSLDWSFDDRYLAVGITGTNLADELMIYYFDGSSITVTASFNFGNQSVNAVAWHPTEYRLAVGNSSSSELYIFDFDPLTASLTIVTEADTNVVNAVAWHPTGSYLAVGQSKSNSLLLYPVDNSGILGSVITTPLGVTTTVPDNALAWDTTGSFLAVGMYATPSKAPELAVYAFNGKTFSQGATLSFGQTVYGVAWRPNSTQLIAGLVGTSENMRLYNYSAGILTEITGARVGEKYPVYATGWSNLGTTLAVARVNDSSGFDLKIWHYDPIDQTFNLATGYDSGQVAQVLSWSRNGTYIALGDRASMVYLLDFVKKPLVFNNAQLFLNSDVVLTTTVVFEGVCTLNTNNGSIDLTNGAIEIGSGSTLYIEQSDVKGIRGNNLYCKDNSSVLSLRNVDMHFDGDTTFTLGALLFQDSVRMFGNTIFAYKSTQSSIILTKSNLTIDIGMTFSYDPVNRANNLLIFESNSSIISLNGATLHATSGGLQITDGVLRILRDSRLSSDGSYDLSGIFLGEGITVGNDDLAHDLVLDIYGGQTLYVTSGSLNYRNVNPESLRLGNLNSSFYFYPNTRFNIYQNVYLNYGFMTIGNNVLIGRTSNVDIIGSWRPLGSYLTTSL